mgnify:CR=1 FL=1
MLESRVGELQKANKQIVKVEKREYVEGDVRKIQA